MRKVLIVLFITLYISTSYATDARVLTMGRQDDFFMDDVSMFRNPANINLYPNMMIGSYGYVGGDDNLHRPFFGGVLSFSSDKENKEDHQYPMFSVGFIFNRYDDALGYITPGDEKFFGWLKDSAEVVVDVAPVGKVDIIAGITTKKGWKFGLGGYLAFQQNKTGDDLREHSLLGKGTIGINAPLAKTIDMDASFNFGLISQVGSINGGINNGNLISLADHDFFFDMALRFFSAMASVNGDFVPKAGFKYYNFDQSDSRLLAFDAGFGFDINIDRGFFWAGFQGFYESRSSKKGEIALPQAKSPTQRQFNDLQIVGGKVSFGIERNLLFDWLLWRVGGTKVLAMQRTDGQNGKFSWVENPEEDHASFGFGVNIENRFKIDAVLSENIFYNFTHLLSGKKGTITTKLTATYNF